MPIIESLLDTDYYKLTMGQFAWRRYLDVSVKYAFKNRTVGVSLARIIPEEELRFQFDSMRALSFSQKELKYLASLNRSDGDQLFCDDYLKFLKELRLPEYNLERIGDDYKMEFPGKWPEAIFWETPALAIKNELYYKKILEKEGLNFSEIWMKEGKSRLNKKISILKTFPELASIIEFGTRRRFSRECQKLVLEIMFNEICNQISGTSNIALAMELGISPIGTMAHETFMIISGVMNASNREIYDSHKQVLREWRDEYDFDLSIALTDTYGSDFFFSDFDAKQAVDWKGLRQDSGNPIIFGEKAIAFYKNLGIDPMEKLIVFSDGLDVETIVKIFKHFYGKIQMAFGWGTNLTNDLGIKPLSLVIKAVEACGHGLVKLSDNMAKAIGKPGDIDRFKRIFKYTEDLYEECLY